MYIFLVVSFKFFNDATGNQLHFRFGCGEVEEWTGIEEGRATDADVYLFGAAVVESFYMTLKLGAPNNGVVAKSNSLAFKKAIVWDELHVCNQISGMLIGWRKTSGPGGRIFDH